MVAAPIVYKLIANVLRAARCIFFPLYWTLEEHRSDSNPDIGRGYFAMRKHVRFNPESGHVRRTSPCPLSANSGQPQRAVSLPTVVMHHCKCHARKVMDRGRVDCSARHRAADHPSSVPCVALLALMRESGHHVERLRTAEAPALWLGLRVRWRCKGANQNNAPGTPTI